MHCADTLNCVRLFAERARFGVVQTGNKPRRKPPNGSKNMRVVASFSHFTQKNMASPWTARCRNPPETRNRKRKSKGASSKAWYRKRSSPHTRAAPQKLCLVAFLVVLKGNQKVPQLQGSTMLRDIPAPTKDPLCGFKDQNLRPLLFKFEPHPVEFASQTHGSLSCLAQIAGR